MSDRSKELAKLLEIEPKWFDKQSEYIWDTYAELKKDIFNQGWSKEYSFTQLKINCVKVYPDFEKPKNFVKLLELAYKISGIIDINFIKNKTNFIDDFITDAIEAIKKYSDNHKIIEFKNQAQQQDWSY